MSWCCMRCTQIRKDALSLSRSCGSIFLHVLCSEMFQVESRACAGVEACQNMDWAMKVGRVVGIVGQDCSDDPDRSSMFDARNKPVADQSP